MYVYNVTVNIDATVHEEWLSWMKQKHIPDVMATGCFTESRMLKVLNVDDAGHTYSIQYAFRHMSDIEKYQKEFAGTLQAEHKEKFGDNYAAFRTLLQLVD